MDKPEIDWNPSWDDDWRNELTALGEAAACDNPQNPDTAAQEYRGGCLAERYRSQGRSDIEAEMYVEYMSPEPETDDEEVESPGVF